MRGKWPDPMATLFPKSWLKAVSSPLFAVPLFAVLGLVGILNHAMWRDEMNTWLIVRDSASLGEMLGYVNYQGHPALWALLVSLVRNLADTPVVMQLLHWGLGLAAMIIFWRYSQFPRWQKLLFTFGYLPFFEYFLISRPYVLGMLFLFIFCALFPTREKSYVGLAIALGLMANSHAFAALISLAAAITLGLEFWGDPVQRSRYLQQAKKYDWLLSLGILIALYLCAYLILQPPADSANLGGRGGWLFAFDLRKGLKVFGRLLAGYTLIEPASKWLDRSLGALVGLSLAGLMAVRLMGHRTAFLFYGLATGDMLTFFYVRFMGSGARHYGYLYLILIASLWLSQHPSTADGRLGGRLAGWGRSRLFQKAYSIVFTLSLLFHLGGGIYRFYSDVTLPFSATRAAAQYIKSAQLTDTFIVASPDTNMASLSGYLGRQLYYPSLQGLGSFTIFQQGRRVEIDQPAQVLEQVEALVSGPQRCELLLVLNQPLEESRPALTLVPLAQFERSWHRSERMYLYRVTPASEDSAC